MIHRINLPRINKVGEQLGNSRQQSTSSESGAVSTETVHLSEQANFLNALAQYPPAGLSDSEMLQLQQEIRDGSYKINYQKLAGMLLNQSEE